MYGSGGGEKASISGIAQVDGAVVASATIVTNTGHGDRFANNGTNVARVMVVDPDGRTIVDGADGTLSLVSQTASGLVLSAPTTVADDGFIVP